MDLLQQAIDIRNRGITGTDGVNGAIGPQGPQGIQGEPGPKGDKGDTGDTGPAGADGINGTNGIDGINGTNGIDGINGTNGVGVPTGGTAGQALVKIDSTDYNTQWATITSGGGGYVGDFDGGHAATIYGGIDPIDGGYA